MLYIVTYNIYIYICIVLVYTVYIYIYIYIVVFLCLANFADDGEHPLAEAKVYYTRLAEPIGQLWATNPRHVYVASFIYSILCIHLGRLEAIMRCDY